MQTPLHTFVPFDLSLPISVWFSALVGIAAIIGVVFLLKPSPNPEARNQRIVGAMLFFFIAIMALGTAFFSFWNSRRTLAPVQIFADRIESGYGTSSLKNIRAAYLKVEDRNTLFPTPQNTRKDTFLMVEEKNGRAHVFNHESYPVKQMARVIREMIK